MSFVVLPCIVAPRKRCLSTNTVKGESESMLVETLGGNKKGSGSARSVHWYEETVDNFFRDSWGPSKSSPQVFIRSCIELRRLHIFRNGPYAIALRSR